MLLTVAIPLGAVLIVLSGVAISLTSRPVQGTEGLISQEGMLVGIFQGALGLAVALSTIYYALRTGDMVESMQTGLDQQRSHRTEAAAGNLVGAALGVAAAAGGLSGLMARDWRWHIPGRAIARDKIAIPTLHQLMTRLADTLRWAEEVAYLEPRLKNAANAIVTAALAAHDDAVAGRSERMTEDARLLRQTTDALRHQIAQPER